VWRIFFSVSQEENVTITNLCNSPVHGLIRIGGAWISFYLPTFNKANESANVKEFINVAQSQFLLAYIALSKAPMRDFCAELKLNSFNYSVVNNCLQPITVGINCFTNGNNLRTVTVPNYNGIQSQYPNNAIIPCPNSPFSTSVIFSGEEELSKSARRLSHANCLNFFKSGQDAYVTNVCACTLNCAIVVINQTNVPLALRTIYLQILGYQPNSLRNVQKLNGVYSSSMFLETAWAYTENTGRSNQGCQAGIVNLQGFPSQAFGYIYNNSVWMSNVGGLSFTFSIFCGGDTVSNATALQFTSNPWNGVITRTVSELNNVLMLCPINNASNYLTLIGASYL